MVIRSPDQKQTGSDSNRGKKLKELLNLRKGGKARESHDHFRRTRGGG